MLTAEPLDRVDTWELPRPALLRRFGADADALARVADRPHVQLVHAVAPVDDAPASLLRVRRSALALAAEHDGVVLDLSVPRVVADSEVDPTVARHWVTFDLGDDELISRGLAAFGLPELRATTGPNTAATIAVLTGLVHRLIAEWPDHDPVGPAAVTLRDVAFGSGDASAADLPPDPSVGVLIDYDGESLVVNLVDDPAVLFG